MRPAFFRALAPLLAVIAAGGSMARAIDATTVFNEVMYHPPGAADAEWIELHNEMAVNMDLSGWQITGGIGFTFPAGTTIPAGGFLVIASNPAALQNSAGITGVLGPWSGALANSGDSVTLRNRIGREMDVFSYQDSGQFPVAADAGGVSLVKRAPGLSSARAENWTYSPQIKGTPGAENFPNGQALGPAVTLAAFGDAWTFNQSGTGRPANWAQTVYAADTDGWQSGPGLFAFKTTPPPLPVGTVLNDPGAGVITHYFQRSFNFSGDPAQTAVQLTTLLDDGAIVFLNGFEVARINMAAGAVSGTTRAVNAIDNAVVSSPLTLPGNRLVAGTNVLSVELHQAPETGGGGPLAVVEQAGTLETANNLARGAGAVAFAKDVLAGYPTIHNIPHINDGVYGNSNSWIGNSFNSYCAINLGATPKTVQSIAWGRDNSGGYADRTLGTYTVQYTTTPNPSASTPDSAWTTVGSINYGAQTGPLFSAPSLRHRFNFTPVSATGIRLICPGNGIGDGSCVDELELYANALPAPERDAVFGAQLVSREILSTNGVAQIGINEIAGSTDAVWRIELRNNGTGTVDPGGLVIASSNAPTGYVLPSQPLAPGGLLVLDQTQLGFRPLSGDRIFLYNPSRTLLFDAAVVRTTVRARSGPEFLSPTAASFGAENAFTFETGIVINEVMYHFPPNSSSGALPVTSNPEEWIELHNRTAAPINVGGWQLDTAIEFTIPLNTQIGAGDFLVIARDATALAGKWPEVAAKIIGNFSGSFSNKGERIVLKDARGNPANEVLYSNGGAWPSLADGNGASLELRDPRADNANGAAWGAGSATAPGWQTVTYRMTSGQTYGQTLWNEFRIGMLSNGECLIDDVSVVRDPAGLRQELIQGGNFESLTNKWRMVGNHGTSAIETDPADNSNHVLHVRATGQFGYNHNHIESTFLNNIALVDGQVYEVTFRARWISGSNQLNTRAYYSRLARTTELALPTRIGTPGTQNSRFVSNLGPTMSGLAHAPVLPAAGEAVTVSVRAADPDNVATVTLRYAVNGGTTFATAPMTLQSSGLYTASVPGQSAGAIVQFYVEALDGAGASSQLPAAGPNSRALFIVNDGQGSTLAAHELRVIMLPADSAALLAPLNRVSDARIPGTAIYRRSEIFYDAGIRLQGTAAGRIRDGEQYTGYDVGFPADHLFRGVHDSVNIDRSGRGPVVRGQDEIYVKHMFHRAGVPCSYDDLCYFVAPAAVHTGTAILQMAGYEQTFVDSQFDGDGSVYSLDGTYEPATTTNGNVESFKNPVPLATQFDTDFTSLGADKEQYRAPLEPRAGRRNDDFTGLIAFCQTMALPDAQLAQQIGARMDVDEWMRCAALYSLCGIADCYMNGGFSHNFRVHVPSDGQNVSALPWDMDFVFNATAGSSAILATKNLRRVIEIPANKRLYYGHLYDLCQTTFSSAYMTPWMTHYGSVVGQNMSAQSGYIEARRNSVLSQLPAQTAFAITTNNGAPFSVANSTIALDGTGWINIREFRRADTGAVVPATWTTQSTWRLTVALNFGENPITLQAYDFQGQLVGAKSITITSTLPSPIARDFLRITELHYKPAGPVGAELNVSTDRDDFEFIELRNLASDNLNIGGCAFIDGIDFTFPADTVLAAGERILLVRNIAAFQARYGTAPRIAGAYGPADALSNNGELITLVDATGAPIQAFNFDHAAPWPTGADGGGYSLIPIAPQLSLDRSSPSNWRASLALGGNPGAGDSTVFAGLPGIDADNDGLNAFLEYALGSSDTASGPGALTVVSTGADRRLSFSRRATADDVACVIESSTDFITWTTAPTELLTRVQTGGLLNETHRLLAPAAAQPRLFVRLRVDSR
ncbi:MAG: hypothetical protein JWL59_3617 [Chthoniobacteraceae bacterium]|nr:hypothetical protein [Chthoniobacteraceae bacterium]